MEYSPSDILLELYCRSSPLEERHRKLSPYTHNALERSLDNYRAINLGHLIASPVLKNMTPRYLDFVSTRREAMLIFNVVCGVPVSVVFRDFQLKELLFMGSGSGLFYNLGGISETFKYGDPVLLVEGPLDADSIKHIFPSTLALLHASLSVLQVEILSLLTNRVLLLLDADSAGEKSTKRSVPLLIKKGIIPTTLNHPPGVKDPGTLAEYSYFSRTTEHIRLESYYKYILSPHLK